MRFLDDFLDNITMYRLLLYYLGVLLAAAMVLGALGYMPYSPLAIFFETAYLLLVCWITNKVFAYGFNTPSNPESSLITALILALIITPPASPQSFEFITAAAGLAISSKYILSIRRQHIFNPAAIAVTLTAIGAGQAASWWVGTTWLVPIAIIGGLLLVRKIQRGQMVSVFIVAALASTIIVAIFQGGGVGSGLSNAIVHSPLFFMGFVMLTEPLTSPGMLKQQRWYGLLAGLLFPPELHILGLYSSPEYVLVISNIYAYIVSPRVKLLPQLVQKITWGPTVKDFIFTPDRRFDYLPGQYMEWTLPHDQPDNRGVRRYFTLASSPTEETLRIGVKFYARGSSFKQAMWSMGRSTPIAAAQLGGDFTLPEDNTRKLVFIAGGIGITPFRSMLKYLTDTNDRRKVTLLYAERDPADLAYDDVLSEATHRLGTRVMYVLARRPSQQADLPGIVRLERRITPQLISEAVPDYKDCLFYISGSHTMVEGVQDGLHSMGVHEYNVKTDFFPGYA